MCQWHVPSQAIAFIYCLPCEKGNKKLRHMKCGQRKFIEY